jgi:hypothetical protein
MNNSESDGPEGGSICGLVLGTDTMLEVSWVC